MDQHHSIDNCDLDSFPFEHNPWNKPEGLYIDTEHCSRRYKDGFMPVNFCPTCGQKLN